MCKRKKEKNIVLGTIFFCKHHKVPCWIWRAHFSVIQKCLNNAPRKERTHFFNPYYPLQIDPKPILCCVPWCGSHIKGPLFLPKMSRGESVQNFRPPLTNGGSTFVFTGQISIIKDPSRHHFWAIFFDENFPCTSLAPSNWPPTLLHCLLVCKSDLEK